MKKLLCFILIFAICFTLPACVIKDDPINGTTDGTADNITNDTEAGSTTDSVTPALGLVTDHASFQAEVSKRIDLDSYTVSIEESLSTNAVTQIRTYTHKEGIQLQESHTPFTVTIDGIAIQMPATVEQFSEKGFQVSHIDGQIISGGADLNQPFYYGILTFKSPKGKSLDAYVIATDRSAPTKMKYCIVMQLCPDLYTGEQYYPDGKNPQLPEMVYFNGITNDATLDDILTKLGQPQKMTHSFTLYNGKVTISYIQIYYYFENSEYSGSITFTVDIFRLPDGSRANMAHDISYNIKLDI